jgi:hypothetical protein
MDARNARSGMELTGIREPDDQKKGPREQGKGLKDRTYHTQLSTETEIFKF